MMSFMAVELPRLGYRQYPKAAVRLPNFDAHLSGIILAVARPGTAGPCRLPARADVGYRPD